MGLDEEQVRFLDLFLTWAALSDSDPMDNCELECCEEGKQWTAGVDYVFDKQTTAYLFYTDLDLELESDNSIAIGLKYKF